MSQLTDQVQDPKTKSPPYSPIQHAMSMYVGLSQLVSFGFTPKVYLIHSETDPCLICLCWYLESCVLIEKSVYERESCTSLSLRCCEKIVISTIHNVALQFLEYNGVPGLKEV